MIITYTAGRMSSLAGESLHIFETGIVAIVLSSDSICVVISGLHVLWSPGPS